MKTRAELMDEGLNLAGLSSSQYSLARGWINTFIERQAMDFDWPFYAATYADQAFVAGQTEYSVPSDFARPNENLFLVQNNQQGGIIRVVEPAIFQLERTPALTSGVPRVCYIKTTYTAGAPVQTVVFECSPASGNSTFWRMPYFRKPVALSTSSSDDSKIPDFMNQALLIEEITRYGMKHQDDSRYAQQKADTEGAERKAKFNTFNQASPKVQLSPDVFRTGRRRGGTGGGFMGP